MISNLFHFIFYKPLYNALVFLVGAVPGRDVGISVIILTLVIQFILLPFRHSSVITQRKMREIDPEVRKIKEQFKKDKAEQTKRIMALYKSHGVSPFSGFLMLFIQLPVFIALYKLFSAGIGFNSTDLYSFVAMPDFIKSEFLGLFDISKSNNYILAIAAGLTQFFQIHLSFPKISSSASPAGNSFGEQLSRSISLQSRFIMPIFIFFIALKFSSAIALYWTTMNVFAILHEAVVALKAKRISEQKNHGFISTNS